MARILLVENDARLAVTLKRALESGDLRLVHALTLSRAYELLQSQGFDLVIADRILDDGDGLELAIFLAETSPTTRFIFLSQKGAVVERLAGLRDGADEYLAKPFSLEELKLKVNKLLQMHKLPTTDFLQGGPLQLYEETGTLLLPEGRRQLRRKESQILACLIRFPGSIVSRQRLIEHVWRTETAIPSFTTLDVYIRRLRLKLGVHARLIKTVRGFGYMLDL